MKKRIIAIVAVIAVCVCGLAFAACSDSAVQKYTVTYYANGGIFDSGNTTYYEKVEKGGYAKGKQTPTNANTELEFLGWGASADATKVVDLAKTPITKNTSLYAVWHVEVLPPEQRTVTFYYNYDGAPSAVYDTKYIEDGSAVTKPTDPTRPDHTFDGWHTSANTNSPYVFSSPVSDNLSLYAHWTKNADPVVTGIEVYTEPTKTEYVAGQAFSSEGLVVRALFSEGKAPQTLVMGEDYTLSEPDMTVFGKQTVTVTYEYGAGKLTAVFEINIVAKAVAELEVTGGIANVTQEVGAKFDPAGLSFKAVYNDGSELPLTAADVTFTSTLLGGDGKFTAAGAAEITVGYDGVTSATKLHVTVEEPAVPKHDVVFAANITAYAPINMPATRRLEEGQEITEPAVSPSIKGYTFGGWYTTAECETAYDFASGVVGNADITLYAKWTAKTYTVAYSLNGGTGGQNNPATYTVNAQGVFEDAVLASASKAHNVFGGWYTGSAFPEAGKVDKLSYSLIPDDGDTITLYAKFTPETYTLKFDLGGSADPTSYRAAYKAGVTAPSGYAYGDTVEFPSAEDIAITPNTAGEAVEFNFLGWYLQGDENKTRVMSISPDDFGDKVFVANIIQATVRTVTFDYNYEGSTPRPVKVVDGGNVQAINPAPTRKGYVFDGWFTTDKCETPFDFEQAIKQDTSAYAKWVAVAPERIAISADSRAKTEYNVGDVLSLDGLVLDVSYNNGTQITAAYADCGDGMSFTTQDANIESGAIGGKARTATVTVGYLNLSVDFEVTISNTLTSVAQDATSSVKTEYVAGDALDLSGLVVNAIYNEQVGETVTVALDADEYATSPLNGAKLTESVTKITITYEDKTLDIQITVAPLAITAVAASGEPTTNMYHVGDEFSPAGLVFTATYNNGATGEIDASSITFNGGSKLIAAGDAVRVSATLTANADIVVTGMPAVKVLDALTSIVVTKPTRTTYPQYVDADRALAALDKSGMTVTARYNEGIEGATVKSVDISLDSCTVSCDFSAVGVGAGVITLTYADAVNGGGKSATVSVDITAPAVVSIEATVKGGATDTYFVGDSFALSNIEFTATYDNGDEKVLAASEFTVAPFEAAGESVAVVVTYKNPAVVISGLPSVRVADKLTGITATPPDGLHTAKIFVVGDTVTAAGMTVTAFYNGDTENGKAVTGFTANTADIDMSTAGVKTITVTYSENGITKTATVEITVVDKAITALDVVGTPEEQYKGALFNKSGLTFTAIYNNDDTAPVAADDITFTSTAFTADGAFRLSGSQTVVATYGGVTCDIAVTVANIDKFTVTFDGNIAAYEPSGIPAQVSVTYGEKVPTYAAPTLKGFVFGGWYKEAECTTEWDFETATVDDNMTLYAKWTAVEYGVEYAATGLADNTAFAHENASTYSADDGAVALKPATTTEAHKVFVGWTSGGETVAEIAVALVADGKITLTAVFEDAPTYSVEFNLMYEGAPAIEAQTVYAGEKAEKPANPTREEYEFAGWFKDDALKTTWDFDVDVVNEATTLYAKWMALTNKFVLVNGTTQIRMYDNTAHNTDTAVKEEYTLLGETFAKGDALSFKSREDGVLTAITVSFDSASKGVTFASNTLTTKSEGSFDIYLKLSTSGTWTVYASGGDVLDGDYYIAGTMNEWATDTADYKLDNKSGSITLDLPVNAKFKVIDGNLTGDDRWLGYYFAGTGASRVKAGADYVEADGENNFQIKESAKYRFVFDGEYLSITRVGNYEGEPVIVMPEYSAMFKFKDGKSLIIKLGKMPVQTATDWQGLDTSSAFAYAEGVTTWDNRYKLNGSTYTIDKNLSEVSFMIGFMQWSDGKNTTKIACTDFVEGKVNVVNSVNNYGSWNGSNWNYTLSTEEITYE